MSSSVFNGEKVIFPTLPGSHLSFGCHNNSDVAKVTRVTLGVSQNAERWRSGHMHKGTGITVRFSGKVGTQFGGVPKLEQPGKPCHGNECVLLQRCSHGFIMAAPAEVGDAVPLPLGSPAMKITDGILQETFVCVAMFVLRVMSIFATTPCIFKLGLNGIQCPQCSSFQIICHVRKWF